MLPLKKFEIVDLEIAGNALELSILLLPRYLYHFKSFTIPSDVPFWLLEAGAGVRAHPRSPLPTRLTKRSYFTAVICNEASR